MVGSTVESHILCIVCSVFDAYSAVLFLPAEDGDGFRRAAPFSLGDEIITDEDFRTDKGLVGWLLRSHEPLRLTSFDREKNSLGYYRREDEVGIKAFMAFPIATGGVLCVDSKREYSFSEKDQKMLHLFADLISGMQKEKSASLITGNIPRYFVEFNVLRDLRNKYKRWPQYILNFVRTLADASGFDYCAFASTDGSGETYRVECETRRILMDSGQPIVLPMGCGLTGWVFRNEQPVFAGTIETSPSTMLFGKQVEMPDFQAAVCLPVTISRSTRAVICLAHMEPLEIDEVMRSFLLQCVDHLAMHLENLYLQTRLNHLLPQAHLHRNGAPTFETEKNEDEE